MANWEKSVYTTQNTSLAYFLRLDIMFTLESPCSQGEKENTMEFIMIFIP